MLALEEDTCGIRARAASNLLCGFDESTLTYATLPEAATAGALTRGVEAYMHGHMPAPVTGGDVCRSPVLFTDVSTTTAGQGVVERILGNLPPLEACYVCIDPGLYMSGVEALHAVEKHDLNYYNVVVLHNSFRMPSLYAGTAKGPWYISWDERPRPDPFAELLDDKMSEAKLVIAKWALSKNADASLVQRLSSLVQDARDESPETEVPSAQALTSVFNLFRALPTLRKARLAVAGAAGIWAEWVKDQHHSLALQFLRNGSVNLAAFFLDPEDQMRAGSYASNFSWQTAAKALRTDDALNWVLTK